MVLYAVFVPANVDGLHYYKHTIKNNDSGMFRNIFGFMNESLEIKLEDLCSVFTIISNKLSILI